MPGNTDMEIYLAVGKINRTSPNFIPPTFDTCIKLYIEVVTELLCHHNQSIHVTGPDKTGFIYIKYTSSYTV